MSSYNGWTNYETWAVGLYLDGNYDGEGTYRAARQLAADVSAAGDVHDLAAALHEFVEDALPGLDGLAEDLLTSALGEVDWRELAESKRGEVAEQWTTEARRRGADDARAAASWTTDGNTDRDAARRVLRMAEDGDPALDDYLPRRPDLSGEWADGPTPDTLAEEITGTPHGEIDSDLVDVLASAYEDGVAEAFEPAAVDDLRRFVGEETDR